MSTADPSATKSLKASGKDAIQQQHPEMDPQTLEALGSYFGDFPGGLKKLVTPFIQSVALSPPYEETCELSTDASTQETIT